MKNFWKFICFCFVGGTATLIYMIIFNLFFWLGLGFIFSWSSALILAFVYHFFMNRNLTFAHKGRLKRQIPRYIIVYVFSAIINFIVVMIMKSILGEGTLQINIAIFMGIAVSIPFSFLSSLLWIFRKKDF